MKRTRLVISAVILAASFVVAVSAQTAAVSRIALIDTGLFYAEQGGINKIAAAYKVLDTEFVPDFKDLSALISKFEALKKEVEGLQSSPATKPETLRAKVDELEKLQRDIKFKQEEGKARYAKREAAVLEPVVRDISEAIGAFAKQKGFTLVLDSGKLYEARVLIYLQDTTEITKDFIQYYNARPPGTASVKP